MIGRRASRVGRVVRGALRAGPLVRTLASAALGIGALVLLADTAVAQRTTARSVPDAATVPSLFDHSRHESIGCSRCHGTGARHRMLLVRTAQDCLACHHAPERVDACAACHDRGSLPEPATLRVDLTLSVWDSARTRELRFGHELHARVECRTCHARPGSLAMERSCASCHEEHHSPTADCRSCHETPESGVHPAAAHLSCAGVGCHSAQAAPSPVLSRNLCLACHESSRAHMPARECAGCHIPHLPQLRRGGASPGRPPA
ncbi:MAG TPA: cytochrome c3 family protein [Longimicrobiales bacterium]